LLRVHTLSTPNKEESDRKEQELISENFIEVSPFVKLQLGQYSRFQGHEDPQTFESPVVYMISWCVEE
jgi:hypothetical protein